MIKYRYLAALLLLVFSLNSSIAQEKNTDPTKYIRINQVGYFPGSIKKAVVVDVKKDGFYIKNSEGATVFKGKLSKPQYWDKSGEEVRIADFTKLTKPGKYVFYVEELDKGCPFNINQDIYGQPFKAALKSYYLIRASMPIEKKYAGKYARKEGHPDSVAYFHPSAGRGEGKASSSKGWYDAGDYNKYVVNGGVTVGTLLNLYEMFPGLVKDGFTNIPESGNKVSDLLDEVKYELDWMLTMQTPYGASNMKLTSKKFTGFIMPDKDKTDRYFVGIGTAPTLNLAASMAMAARIYKDVDPEFANRCLISAEKAWNWAVKNPYVVYKNPADIITGEYSDKDFTEEFWWAASELYLVTKGAEYKNYLTTHEPYLKFEVSESWRMFLGNLGSFSLLMSDEKLPDGLRKKLERKLVTVADDLMSQLKNNPYLIPVDKFVWGSNSDVGNAAMFLAVAYQVTGEKEYLNGVVLTMDYIFGKNATGYSFMTGFGCKTPMHVHHRISGGDNIKEPLPGFIVGGPNVNREDEGAGVNYPHKEPAKSYVDYEPSFASNETAINWNAPVVFVLGFLEANADKLK